MSPKKKFTPLLIAITTVLGMMHSNAFATECSAELKKSIAQANSKIEICTLTDKLYQDSKKPVLTAFLVEMVPYEVDETGESELDGLTVSLWQVEKKGDRQIRVNDFPVYQESQLGDELLDFVFEDKKVQYAFADFNNDGTIDFALNALANPMAALILKSHNSVRQSFDNLGHRIREDDQWIQFPYFIAEPNSKIEIKRDSIEIQTSKGPHIYRLEGTQFEKRK